MLPSTHRHFLYHTSLTFTWTAALSLFLLASATRGAASGDHHWLGSHKMLDLLSPALFGSHHVIKVPGQGGYSDAYELLDDDRRNLVVPSSEVTSLTDGLLLSGEFTLLFLFRQRPGSVGALLSLSLDSVRVLEVENSGRRDELRVHVYNDVSRRLVTETFPVHLADGQWHQVAISVTRSSHVQLHVDCHLSYERPLAISPRHLGTLLNAPRAHPRLWIGQRALGDNLLKGALQYVKVIFSAQGFLAQCPHGNVGCPMCSQFNNMEHTIDKLLQAVDQLTKRLEVAEAHVARLQTCECQRSCDVNGVKYEHGHSWKTDTCTTCQCLGGEVVCKQATCAPVHCKHPVQVKGQCCPSCLKHCFFNGVYYEHGQSASFRHCTFYTCQDGRMVYDDKQNQTQCAPLDCAPREQISLPDKCCKYCPGSDFCADVRECHVNATCYNQDKGYTCQCNEGFQGNGRTCSDIDECTTNGHQRHRCHSNTICVNTIGSYECTCPAGFSQVDSYSCQDIDECTLGTHSCHPWATCTNTQGSFQCTCQQGYVGDGFSCTPVCDRNCDGVKGVCVQPDVCQCRAGYMGADCSTDIDECAHGMVSCAANSTCVNWPGSYECQCLPGYSSYGRDGDNRQGQHCRDIDECRGWGEGDKCPRDSLCVNRPGSYECQCKPGVGTCSSSTGCNTNGRYYKDMEKWTPRDNHCQVCQCRGGEEHCEPVTCDCNNPDSSVAACCSSQCKKWCVRSDTAVTVASGHTWRTHCQQCLCLDGEVDCWSVPCLTSGQCVATLSLSATHHQCDEPTDDPCLSAKANNGTASCYYDNVSKPSGSIWNMSDESCTTCRCQNGVVCCRTARDCPTAVPPPSSVAKHAHVRPWVRQNFFGVPPSLAAADRSRRPAVDQVQSGRESEGRESKVQEAGSPLDDQLLASSLDDFSGQHNPPSSFRGATGTSEQVSRSKKLTRPPSAVKQASRSKAASARVRKKNKPAYTNVIKQSDGRTKKQSLANEASRRHAEEESSRPADVWTSYGERWYDEVTDFSPDTDRESDYVKRSKAAKPKRNRATINSRMALPKVSDDKQDQEGAASWPHDDSGGRKSADTDGDNRGVQDSALSPADMQGTDEWLPVT